MVRLKKLQKPKRKPSLANLESPRTKRPEDLTDRERSVLELIWAGLTNKDIGQRLKISAKTVEAHRANMMKKMRVSNTAQLLRSAILQGSLQVR